jgi:hypothetical protein
MGPPIHYPFVGLLFLTISMVTVSFHTFTSLTHAHTPRHVFGNPYKTFSFLLCFYSQKKYNMLPFLWQYIKTKRMKKKSKEEKRKRKS